MRAAKTVPHWQRNPTERQPPKLLQNPGKEELGCVLGFGALFLVGYTVGILICREQTPEIGSAFAQYYMDKQNYTSFAKLFVRLFSALFLQSGMVLLCGMNAVGIPLLAAFFGAKGALLGICAASVFLTSEARGLVVYWLMTCLPDVVTLVLLLWLAKNAAETSGALFRTVLSGAGTRGTLERQTKKMLIRYLVTLGIGAVCSTLGAASSGLFAGVLL